MTDATPEFRTVDLPGVHLRGCHLLPGAGHRVQRERADTVNDLLNSFLKGLP